WSIRSRASSSSSASCNRPAAAQAPRDCQAQEDSMAHRPLDPFANFNFLVESGGLIQAGFSECTGLNSETNVIEYREGADDTTVRKLSGLSKFGNVTLK